MPLTESGRSVLSSMVKQYGSKKGKAVFYASINKGTSGSSKWHKKKKQKKEHYSRDIAKKALERYKS